MNNIQQVNLKRFFAGDHKAWTMTFYDKIGQLVLNGRRIVVTIKQDVDDTDENAVIKKVHDISGTEDIKQFVFTLTTDETKNLYGVYEYDIRVSFVNQPTEIQYTAVRGKLTVDKPITRTMG